MQQTPRVLPEDGTEVYLVGDLRVDVGQQRVTRAGDEIPLPNLSLRMLITLIHAAPNVVSNEMLMTSVWPRLIVSPETVNKRAKLLRDALGDDSRKPLYIAGVRSRGYRLIAPVSLAVNAPLAQESSRPMPETGDPPVETHYANTVIDSEPTKPRRSHLWRGAAFSGIAALAILAAIVFIRSSHGDNSPHDNIAVDARVRTVAVMPFDNISADPADAYLAQGFPEMILDRLSRIDGLSVIARNSSFVLSTKTIDSSEIGRRLNSGYLIGGSVQREANRLRVAVQLVDTAAGTLVWSAHFDRGLHDIFTIEDEIADQIAAALSVRVGEIQPNPQPVSAVRIWRLILPSCRAGLYSAASPSPSRQPRRRILSEQLRWILLLRPHTLHCTTRRCKRPISAARI